MQINHNIRAMVTQHSLYSNDNQMSKSLEKLSTGLKINRAQDDSAGLAMSEQMRTQIRGLGKAKQNSQDSIAALQIAEGGLAEITNIMQRQRELAIQASNDTLTKTERKYLNDEFQELTKEIGRIAKTTDYNGKNMLNWSDDPNESFGAIPNKTADELLELITNARAGKDEDNHNHTDGINELVAKITSGDTTEIDDAIDALTAALTFTFAAGDSRVDKMKELDDLAKDLREKADLIKVGAFTDSKEAAYAEQIKSTLLALGDASSGLVKAWGVATINEADPDADTTRPASFTLHVGPNYSSGMASKWGNEMAVKYLSVDPAGLDLTTRRVLTQNDATTAIDALDKAIKSVSGARAAIGTYINRLEYTINNIANLEFNTQDAESRIRDTDFAKETTNFTRNQIMVQSATSMLAQANSLPQSVLGLIG